MSLKRRLPKASRWNPRWRSSGSVGFKLSITSHQRCVTLRTLSQSFNHLGSFEIPWIANEVFLDRVSHKCHTALFQGLIIARKIIHVKEQKNAAAGLVANAALLFVDVPFPWGLGARLVPSAHSRVASRVPHGSIFRPTFKNPNVFSLSEVLTSIPPNVYKGFTGSNSRTTNVYAGPHGFTGCTGGRGG